MPTRACRGIEYPTTRILLILAGEMATPGAARDYQRNYLGRFDGVSRLSPLFPLPSPSSNCWNYPRWSDLAMLVDRAECVNNFGAPVEGSLVSNAMPPPMRSALVVAS